MRQIVLRVHLIGTSKINLKLETWNLKLFKGKFVKKLGKYRLTLVVIGIVVVVGASLPAFMTASCLTRQQTPAELRALEGLRAMTRGGVLPSEDVVARIESDYPRTKAAALARIVRARIRLNSKDFAGAASLYNREFYALVRQRLWCVT